MLPGFFIPVQFISSFCLTMRLSLALPLGLFALSYSYIVDGSCAAYKNLLTEGMKSGFDLAQAAHDVLYNPNDGARDTPASIAQQDLLKYMFRGAVGNGEKRATVNATFEAVLKFNTNNGNPEVTPHPSSYWLPATNKVLFFCDYKRFNIQTDRSKNKDCSGALTPNITCDSLMKVNVPIDSDMMVYCLNPTKDKSFMVSKLLTSDTISSTNYVRLGHGFRRRGKIQSSSYVLGICNMYRKPNSGTWET